MKKAFDPNNYIKEMENGFLNIDWKKLSEDHWQDHECQPHVVARVLSNGVLAHYSQCPVCGRGNAVKKNGSSEELPTWDDSVHERRQQEWIEYSEQIRRILDQQKTNKNSDWWQWYNSYLKSPAWANRRDRVLKRCNYICEGCGERRAVLAHHLTYDRAGDEMLFDLAGLCSQCHERVHPKQQQEAV